MSTSIAWEHELQSWLEPFLTHLHHPARRRMCPLYVAGLIGPGERKSLQPMAARVAPRNDLHPRGGETGHGMGFILSFWRSTIGKKVVMAVTGLILVGFVVGQGAAGQPFPQGGPVDALHHQVGPVVVLALEAEDAIKKWRTLMGATDPAKAEAGTLRKEFGASIENNATHGSDAPETAREEIAFFFSGRLSVIVRMGPARSTRTATGSSGRRSRLVGATAPRRRLTRSSRTRTSARRAPRRS